MNQLAEFDAAAPAAKPVGNTVMDIPESQFRMAWISILSAAMLKSGKGFRVDSPKRRPPQGAAKYRGERRSDKPGTTKLSRALMS